MESGSKAHGEPPEDGRMLVNFQGRPQCFFADQSNLPASRECVVAQSLQRVNKKTTSSPPRECAWVSKTSTGLTGEGTHTGKGYTRPGTGSTSSETGTSGEEPPQLPPHPISKHRTNRFHINTGQQAVTWFTCPDWMGQGLQNPDPQTGRVHSCGNMMAR